MMKKGIFTLLLFACFTVNYNNNLAQSYQITNVLDSLNENCDSIVTASVYFGTFGGNGDVLFNVQANTYTPGPMTLWINWGDGSSSTHTGQTSGYGQPVNFGNPIQHNYSSYGHFNATFIFQNPSNQSFDTSYVNFFNGACNTYIYGYFPYDSDCDGSVDSSLIGNIPIIATGNNGNTYTAIMNQNTAHFPQMVPGWYTFTIDPQWLSNQGLQSTNSFSTGVSSPGNMSFTYIDTLICDSLGGNSGCLSGKVFCDYNHNGVFDANDQMIGGAPVHFQYQNTSLWASSNNQGNFYFNYPNPNQGAIQVSVSQAWLAQNNYYLPNNTQTLTASFCNPQNPDVLFAINCDSAGVPNTDCIGGTIFCDANNNGQMDPNETPLANAPIQIQGNTNNNMIMVYSDSNGVFYYSGNQFNGSVVVVSVNQSWLAQHGYSVSNNAYTVSSNCNNAQPIYIPVNCSNQGCSDLYTNVTPWIGYYQNQNNYIKLYWGNNGYLAPGPYTLTLTFPSGVTPITSTLHSGYSISGNTITWNAVSASSTFHLTDVIGFQVPQGIPSGTQHHYTSTILPTGNVEDCDTTNNLGSTMMIVGNSYDPNDKNVNLPEMINPDVQDELTYVIRFQNTGTAPAQDIYILDTLSSLLDWSTFRVLGYSHFMQVIDLGNGIIKFNFPGIWLPDSTANEPESHGYIIYKIKEDAGNTLGTTILNTAHIYFDWNPAIVTNTTFNQNNNLGIAEVQELQYGVAPNPAKTELNVWGVEVKNAQIIDATGKIVRVIEYENSINISDLQPGVYYLDLTNSGASKPVMFIKE